jgi:hypothetical protein
MALERAESSHGSCHAPRKVCMTRAAAFAAVLLLAGGPHVSIVPQVRLHWVFRTAPSGDSLSARLALRSPVIRPAVGLRATF